MSGRFFAGRRFDRSHLWAAAILFSGMLFRFSLVALGWPAAYNDEGTLGLMARHIAYQGAHPLLYYGQDYLGAHEAYLGAFFFLLLGPSTFSLRLGLIVLLASFLWFMYLLVRLLYNPALALFTLLVLSFGSADVMLRQLIASGVEANPFFWTTLLLLLTCHIALTARPHANHASEAGSRPWRRIALYALWGAVAGVALWSHFLFLPFVIAATGLLFWACRQELRFPALALLLVCFLIGLSPLIIYKVTTPVSSQQNSIFGGGYREPSYPPIKGKTPGQVQATTSPRPIAPLPGQQILGTLLVALPTATSGTALCPLDIHDIWPLTDHSSPTALVCSGTHGLWSLVFLTLGGIATVSAIDGLRRTKASSSEQLSSSLHGERIRHGARLMLLAGGGATLLAFLLYPQASAITPLISARYLVGLLIALPAVLSPLFSGKFLLKPVQSWRERLNVGGRAILLIVLLLAVLSGSVAIFTQGVPQAQAANREQQELIARLLQAHDTYIYADYNDCNRLSFLSNEQIICAALDQGLHPGLDRYFPYRAMVARAPRPAYVLQTGSTQAFLFSQRAASLHIAYRQFTVGGYIVYEPSQHISPA